MGADLICYIAKGPKTFARSQRRQADRWLRELWKSLKKADRHWQQEGLWKDHLPREPAAGHAKPTAFRGQVHTTIPAISTWMKSFHATDGSRPRAISHRRSSWLPSSSFWTGGTPRDTAKRDDPNDRKQQIIVAGEAPPEARSTRPAPPRRLGRPVGLSDNDPPVCGSPGRVR